MRVADDDEQGLGTCNGNCEGVRKSNSSDHREQKRTVETARIGYKAERELVVVREHLAAAAYGRDDDDSTFLYGNKRMNTSSNSKGIQMDKMSRNVPDPGTLLHWPPWRPGC